MTWHYSGSGSAIMSGAAEIGSFLFSFILFLSVFCFFSLFVLSFILFFIHLFPFFFIDYFLF